MKNHQDVCYSKDAGYIEYNGLPGKVKAGCPNTPELAKIMILCLAQTNQRQLFPRKSNLLMSRLKPQPLHPHNRALQRSRQLSSWPKSRHAKQLSITFGILSELSCHIMLNLLRTNHQTVIYLY